MGRFSGAGPASKTALGVGTLSLATLATLSFVESFRDISREDLSTPAGSHGALAADDAGARSTPSFTPPLQTLLPSLQGFASESDPVLSDVSFKVERGLLPLRPSVLFGGGKIPLEGASLISRWVDAAGVQEGGGKGMLLVCPYASEEPEEAFDRVSALFREVGVTEVRMLPHPSEDGFSLEECQRLLSDASGMFFSGGDQKRLYSYLRSAQILPLFQARLATGPLVVSGSSAGTAVMSQRMIAGGRDVHPERWPELEFSTLDSFSLGTGLGHVRYVMDQHFSERKRFERLALAVVHLNTDGVGVDEQTAAIITGDDNRYITALGRGHVTFISRDFRSERLTDPERGVVIIPSGYTFDTESGELFKDEVVSPVW